MLCLLTLVSQKLSGVHVHTHMLGPPLFSSLMNGGKKIKETILCFVRPTKAAASTLFAAIWRQ